MMRSPPSIVPKILEPLRLELRVAHRVHDVLVAEIVLQRAGVLSVVASFEGHGCAPV